MKNLAILTAMAVASCAPAYAQQCAITVDIHGELGETYGEEPIFLGMQADGTVIEIWAGDETWTAFVSRPDGMSCVLTDGVGYERPHMRPNL